MNHCAIRVPQWTIDAWKQLCGDVSDQELKIAMRHAMPLTVGRPESNPESFAQYRDVLNRASSSKLPTYTPRSPEPPSPESDDPTPPGSPSYNPVSPDYTGVQPTFQRGGGAEPAASTAPESQPGELDAVLSEEARAATDSVALTSEPPDDSEIQILDGPPPKRQKQTQHDEPPAGVLSPDISGRHVSNRGAGDWLLTPIDFC